jgi:DNA end-binding protein Ku
MLRYASEVADPTTVNELKGLKEPKPAELATAEKIIDNLAGDFDIEEYRDTYSERVRELIRRKTKGETIVAEQPKAEEAKELMAALQETLKQLEKK